MPPKAKKTIEKQPKSSKTALPAKKTSGKVVAQAKAKAAASRKSSTSNLKVSTAASSATGPSNTPSRRASVSDEEDDTPSHIGGVLDPSDAAILIADSGEDSDDDIVMGDPEPETEEAQIDELSGPVITRNQH